MVYLVAIHAKTFAFLYRNDDFGQDGLVAMRTYGLHQGITLVDTEPFAATPTKWTYRAIYRVGDQRVGQWSKSVSIAVGG